MLVIKSRRSRGHELGKKPKQLLIILKGEEEREETKPVALAIGTADTTSSSLGAETADQSYQLNVCYIRTSIAY